MLAPHEDEFTFINNRCGITNVYTNYIGRTITCIIFSLIVTSIAKIGAGYTFSAYGSNNV